MTTATICASLVALRTAVRLTAMVLVLQSLVAMISASAYAQAEVKTVRAEVFAVPPFVIEQGQGLTGFGIDIWQEVAARLQLRTEYLKEPAPDDAALRANDVDVLVSPVFITAERDRTFDFSYPILEAGQQVMVRDTGETASTNPLVELLSLLFSSEAATWFSVALLLVLVPAHIVWILERRHHDGIIPTRKYFPGILYAAYWSASTLLTQAEQLPRQWLARLITILWMFTGVVFVALFTAQLTATLTLRQIHGSINGPQDLPGKVVGTLANSVSASYLRERNAKIVEFVHTDEMFGALLDKKVDALLLGAPILSYYAAHEGKGLVKLVGPEFRKGTIGFVFPEGSGLRRQVNHALTAMREDGSYHRILDKWFGGEL